MSNQYILNSAGTPVPEPDLHTWGRWLQDNRETRRVAHETIGESRVSTVFLGVDHAWDGGTPLLWETMVFGGPLDGEMDRCGGNRAEAESMHAAMVERVRTEPVPATGAAEEGRQ